MKFTNLLAEAGTQSGVSHACISAYGTIHVDSNGNRYYPGVMIYDGGTLYCNSDANGWCINGDSHFSITCAPNFVYAFTTDGGTAWYGYPGHAWSWAQGLSTSSFNYSEDPFGAQCKTITWHVYPFC